jgi:tRNA(fMet)-specific endonuclease VapC
VTRYLLDTNHASEALLPGSPLKRRLIAGVNQSFHVSIVTVAELWFMVLNSKRVEENTRRLEHVLGLYDVAPFDQAAARAFGQVRIELRHKGRPIPPMDMQIAAIARAGGYVLLTSDAHFSYVDGIQTENWRS